MKKMILLFLIVITVISFSQKLQVQNPILSPNSVNPIWANDNVILNNEPLGMFSGIQKSDGTIFIAVNDTLATTNLGLVIIKSTDGGVTWSQLSGITYRGKYEKIKLVKTNTDSVYCFFLMNSNIYCWNIATTNVVLFYTTGALYRSFDVEVSSTNALYIFVDLLLNNDIRNYGSVDGGYTWGGAGYMTSTGCFPRINKSISGDTIFVNYYGSPFTSDTTLAKIRVARYRETAPGTVSAAGFQDLVTESLPKREFTMAANNGVVWFVYTIDSSGITNIFARRSGDYGASYSSSAPLVGYKTFNQYWFDIKAKLPSNTGFEFVYYSDSLQTGLPTNQSDQLLYGTTTQSGTSFHPFVLISDHPPIYTDKNQAPVIVQLPFNYNSTGVAWVGESGSGKKLYWDALHAVPVELTSFSANKIDNKVVVNWSTATEKNNKGFYVERKKENEQFTQIAFVQGMGTSLEQHNYSFIDKNLNAGKYFYRLRQVDFDGTSAISNTVEVDIANPVDYCLEQNYPNPFNPSTVINYTIPQQGLVTLKVYNVLGKEVATLVNEQQEAGRYNIELNATKLGINSGVYFYTLEAGNFKSTKKMIMMK